MFLKSVVPQLLSSSDGWCQPIHYRLRGDMDKKGAKKIAKVDFSFSFKKLTRWYLLHFWSRLWPILCTEKKLLTLVQKICPKLQHMYKKVEYHLVRGWSFVGWKYWPCREKKLKIAMLNEAVFMVKSKFQILFCKYLCTTCLLQILVSFRSVQLVPFFLTELIEKC